MQPGAVGSERYQKAECCGAILKITVIRPSHGNVPPNVALPYGRASDTLTDKLRARFIKSRPNEIASMPETGLDCAPQPIEFD
jgi:hypothetical protein